MRGAKRIRTAIAGVIASTGVSITAGLMLLRWEGWLQSLPPWPFWAGVGVVIITTLVLAILALVTPEGHPGGSLGENPDGSSARAMPMFFLGALSTLLLEAIFIVFVFACFAFYYGAAIGDTFTMFVLLVFGMCIFVVVLRAATGLLREAAAFLRAFNAYRERDETKER